jgi:hypothetical protein
MEDVVRVVKKKKKTEWKKIESLPFGIEMETLFAKAM